MIYKLNARWTFRLLRRVCFKNDEKKTHSKLWSKCSLLKYMYIVPILYRTHTHINIYGHHKSTIRFEFIMKHIMIGIPARSEFMTYAMASRMGQNWKLHIEKPSVFIWNEEFISCDAYFLYLVNVKSYIDFFIYIYI